MITASLVLYNSDPQEVERLLLCVENSCIEIIHVVDNSSTDCIKDLVLSFPKAIYHYGHGNVGFGEGNNIAISYVANSTYHIVLNPDIIFTPEAITDLACFMDRFPEVGCVKPALTHVDGSFNASVFSLPTPFITLGRRILPDCLSSKINEWFELRDCNLEVTREVPNMSGSFLFIRAEVFDHIGVFDSRFFMYFEDFDLVRRIHESYKVVYYPKVSVIHAHRAEHKYNRKLYLISIKSAIKYFNKWGWFFDSKRRMWNKKARSFKAVIIDGLN